MKKIVLLLAMVFLASPVLAQPGGPGGHGGPGGQMRGGVSMHGGGGVRPPMHAPSGNHNISHRPPATPIHRPTPAPPMHRAPMGPPPRVVHRPPIPRPYIYRPYIYPVTYYSSYYYPTTTTYVTDEYGGTVVVRETNDYAGINTAANVINAAANAATAIRFLTW